VYAFALDLLVRENAELTMGVVTTLLLTLKLLSYLRGFSDTGWSISVLSANFRDVRGFLVILAAILMGFSVSFRLIFGATREEAFRSLRRSFLATFELSVTGTYDPELLLETRHRPLAVVTFVFAITCVLVVALNALISILADSYARVQAHAVANRRREQASLIVEYMSLLPPWKRRQIERRTQWFHTLLEVGADGGLQVKIDDWEGGMNELRRDIQQLSSDNKQHHDRSMQSMKLEFELEIQSFKRELLSVLEDLTDDVKEIKKVPSKGILKFDAKQNAANAVKAV
jgi:Polycystin cation channel